MTGLHPIGAAARRMEDAAGGRQQFGIILLLACVLGLEMADMGTISAVSGPLKQVFGIDNTQVGLLMAVVSFVGAIATLPFGILVDRMARKPILLIGIALWAVGTVLSGLAPSYGFMLGSRIFLGAVVAIASPCVASLTGDYFPPERRARIYGMILAGELVGVGVGFFISGEVSTLLDWRWSFYVMAMPSVALFWALNRYLPEPERGAQSWDGSGEASATAKAICEAGAEPREALVLDSDPTQRSWWWAIRYLFRIPSYSLLIAASALAYYYFAGIRGFGMIYFTDHYGLSRGLVSGLIIIPGIGGFLGVQAGGWISEALLDRGWVSARLIVPAVSLLACVVPFAAAVWVHSVWIGVPALVVGAFFLAAALAPMDAARLDIIHARLWGRAEAGRRALRSTLEGSAPLLFGAMSGWLGGGTEGLRNTFLLMLATLIAASLLAIPAARTYPADVATALASQKRTAQKGDNG